MKDIALSTLGIAGILLHSLIKLYQLRKAGKAVNAIDYFKDEWLPMFISLIMVGVALLCKKEILQLDVAGNIAGNYLGLVFFTIGYMGQSVLITFMGKVASKTGIKDETIQAIALLIGLTLFTSCSADHKLLSLHKKHREKLVEYCAINFPAKDSVHEQVFYQPGETVYTPGETVYADCDSAYRAALDEAARTGIKVIVKRVAVPCPPSTVRVDTVTATKYVQVENKADIKALIDDRDKYSGMYESSHKAALCEAYALCAILLCGIVYGYAKISRRV